MEKEKRFLILSINYKIVVSFSLNAEIYEGQVIGENSRGDDMCVT
jgi:predicted membrane GTPase involved in stress response